MRRLRVIEGRKSKTTLRGLSGIYTADQVAGMNAILAQYPKMKILPAATVAKIWDTFHYVPTWELNGYQSFPWNVAAFPTSVKPIIASQYANQHHNPIFGGMYGIKIPTDLTAIAQSYSVWAGYQAQHAEDGVAPPNTGFPGTNIMDLSTIGWGPQLLSPADVGDGEHGTIRVAMDMPQVLQSDSGPMIFMPPMSDVQTYVRLFDPLWQSGKVQVLTQDWGIATPPPGYMSYPDPTLIEFDPRYGLITPARNVAISSMPDNSLRDIVEFIAMAFAMYAAVAAAGSYVSAGEAVMSAGTETASASAAEAATVSASTEISTAAEEAMREYALADSLGATITQGEANAWIAAIQNAGLSVPESLISAAATAPASGTGTTFQYESAPQPDIDWTDTPTNSQTSSGSTSNTGTSTAQPNPEANVQYEPPQAPTTPNASGSSWTDSFLKQGVQTAIKSAIAPASRGLVSTGARTGTMQPQAPDRLPSASGGTDILMTSESTHTATLARRHFPWWLLVVGAAVIYKVGRKSHG